VSTGVLANQVLIWSSGTQWREKNIYDADDVWVQTSYSSKTWGKSSGSDFEYGYVEGADGHRVVFTEWDGMNVVKFTDTGGGVTLNFSYDAASGTFLEDSGAVAWAWDPPPTFLAVGAHPTTKLAIAGDTVTYSATQLGARLTKSTSEHADWDFSAKTWVWADTSVWTPASVVEPTTFTTMQLEILSDHRLKEQAVQTLLPAYDSNDPESINEILKTTNFRESLLAAHGIGETGYLTLDGQLPLYIMSPQLTSFGSTLGPLGQMTIVKKVNAQSLGFGHAIIDLTQHEQDHFVVGGSHLKTLSFKLVNSRGHVVNLNGAWMSFSLLFQEYH
jgi:hypothetical protein